MGFHGGSLSKEVFPSAVPSCRGAIHVRNTAGNGEIVSPKLSLEICTYSIVHHPVKKNLLLNHSAANSPFLQGHFQLNC